jgi:diketogulonate reductase-like aldo/keto reductase
LLDPTFFYGQKEIPTLDQVPYHVIDFAEDYGFTDLSAETISRRIDNFERRNIFFTKDYITEKNGYSSLDNAEF